MQATPGHKHRRFTKVVDHDKFGKEMDRIFGKKPLNGPRTKSKKQSGASARGGNGPNRV